MSIHAPGCKAFLYPGIANCTCGAHASQKRDLKRAKALKLLEALAEDHENVKTDGDHSWRKCRACLAREELDHNPLARDLMRYLLAELTAKP